MAMGIIDKVIQLHARIGGDAKRTAIRETNSKLTIRSGLNNIAALNEIAELGLTDICGQIGLNQDRGAVLDTDRCSKCPPPQSQYPTAPT
jgi:hypothetical protein